MIIIDTNVLLHSINVNSPLHQAGKNFLEKSLAENEFYGFTWGIIYEFFRVATHPAIFAQPLTFNEANQFIHDFLGAANFFVSTETELHFQAIEDCRQKVLRLSGNLLHDFHTAVLMHEHGIKDIVTYDTDFKAFPWVNIITI